MNREETFSPSRTQHTLDMGDVLCIYNSDNLYIIDNNLIVIHHFITFDLIA